MVKNTAFLGDDSSLVPAPTWWRVTLTYPTFRGLIALVWFLRAPSIGGACTTCRQTLIYLLVFIKRAKEWRKVDKGQALQRNLLSFHMDAPAVYFRNQLPRTDTDPRLDSPLPDSNYRHQPSQAPPTSGQRGQTHPELSLPVEVS